MFRRIARLVLGLAALAVVTAPARADRNAYP